MIMMNSTIKEEREKRRHVCEFCGGVFACRFEDLPKYHYVVGNVQITVCSEDCAFRYRKILKGQTRMRQVLAIIPSRRVGLLQKSLAYKDSQMR